MKKSCIALAATLVFGAASAAVAQPDIAVSDLINTNYYGSASGKAGYAIGTEICNLGDESSDWVANTNKHPVIAQNIYKYDDGRMEQIGIGWLKHGFLAINGNACGLNCQGGGFDELGPGCSDPYDASLNGSQPGMGPRFEVNAATGVFPYPPTGQGQSGNAIYKRVQVDLDDITPSMNPNARYFVEGQYVTQDDAQAGNGANNVSHREVRVENDLDLRFEAPTVEGLGAIHSWAAIDSDVEIRDHDIEADGRMTIASRATDIGGGLWHYEYAIHNITSHRSGRGLEISIPDGVTVSNVGFHDVDYHSGEPYDGTDWASSVAAGSVSWATDTFDTNEDANALRWGTMYNFRFDADAPPAHATAEMELFRPGAGADWTSVVIGPNNVTGSPLVNFAGSCPGAIDLAADNFSAGSAVAVVSGSGPGTTTIPQGSCSGVDLDLANASLVTVLTADNDGSIRLGREIGGGVCGNLLQLVDLATCDLSNTVMIP